jgi:energy-coupling factor transporter ATP-binding protein EcfA2
MFYTNGAILGMRKAEITKKLDEIIDFSGVERYIDTPVKRYSSGMYVRLAFAVAAHLESDILIVDEVLAVGDAEFQKKCIGKMDSISKGNGRTILFVSHNMNSIQKLCSRGILLEDGGVKAIDDINAIVSLYSDLYKSNSDSDELENAENINYTCKNGVEIRAISLEKNILNQEQPLSFKIDLKSEEMINGLKVQLLIIPPEVLFPESFTVNLRLPSGNNYRWEKVPLGSPVDGFNSYYKKAFNDSKTKGKTSYRHPALEEGFKVTDLTFDMINPGYFVHPCFDSLDAWQRRGKTFDMGLAAYKRPPDEYKPAGIPVDVTNNPCGGVRENTEWKYKEDKYWSTTEISKKVNTTFPEFIVPSIFNLLGSVAGIPPHAEICKVKKRISPILVFIPPMAFKREQTHIVLCLCIRFYHRSFTTSSMQYIYTCFIMMCSLLHAR